MLGFRDAFAGGFVAGIVEGKSLDESIDMGHWLASLSIKELGPQYVPSCRSLPICFDSGNHGRGVNNIEGFSTFTLFLSFILAISFEPKLIRPLSSIDIHPQSSAINLH